MNRRNMTFQVGMCAQLDRYQNLRGTITCHFRVEVPPRWWYLTYSMMWPHITKEMQF